MMRRSLLTAGRVRVRRPTFEGLEARRLFSVDFQPAVSLSAAAGPRNLTLADVNNDGRLDLLSASIGDPAVEVRLGNGDGSFGDPSRTAIGGTPVHVAAGDLDGDGASDLVVAHYEGTVGVLLGRGDGTFGEVTLYAAGNHPAASDLADLDADGDLDIAVAAEDDQAYILLGQGDGTFAAAAPVYAGTLVRDVEAADLTGDGVLDLAVTTYFDLVVLTGQGDGTFAAPRSYPANAAAVSVASGDFDGDGDLDLVVANQGNDLLTVHLNDGSGNFAGPYAYTAQSSPTWVEVGDFDGDGALDIASANYYGGVSVLAGIGDGTFAPAVNFAVGSNPDSLAVGDLDGDGALDLVVANAASNDLSILLNAASAPPPAPVIDVADAAVVEGDKGVTYLRFVITLSTPSDAPVTVRFATADGTALAQSDYQALAGTVTFEAGQTTAVVFVAVRSDRKVEADEALHLVLSEAYGALLGRSSALGSILNDDGKPRK